MTHPDPDEVRIEKAAKDAYRRMKEEYPYDDHPGWFTYLHDFKLAIQWRDANPKVHPFLSDFLQLSESDKLAFVEYARQRADVKLATEAENILIEDAAVETGNVVQWVLRPGVLNVEADPKFKAGWVAARNLAEVVKK